MDRSGPVWSSVDCPGPKPWSTLLVVFVVLLTVFYYIYSFWTKIECFLKTLKRSRYNIGTTIYRVVKRGRILVLLVHPPYSHRILHLCCFFFDPAVGWSLTHADIFVTGGAEQSHRLLSFLPLWHLVHFVTGRPEHPLRVLRFLPPHVCHWTGRTGMDMGGLTLDQSHVHPLDHVYYYLLYYITI